MKNIDWKLCLVADAEVVDEKNIIPVLLEALERGVTVVQLRGKKLNTREFLKMSLNVVDILKGKNIPLIINDRVDIALSCDADGVHLGQDDLSPFFARKILGKNKLIGVSVNTVNEAIEAVKEGADYLGVGPIFFTQTKKDLRPSLGLEGLRSIRKKVKVPILAIGGINSKNVEEIIKAGANGVAVVSAILSAKNILKATLELRKAISLKS